MGKLILTAIKNRKVTLFLVLFIIIFGLYSYHVTPKQESPDFSAPATLIKIIYPGASPEDMEKLVVSKIEDKIKNIEGYKESSSTSRNSVGIVIVQVENGVDQDKAWDELRQEIDDLRPELPEGVQEITLNSDLAETAGMIISMSGEGYSYEQLADYAEDLKDEFMKVKGVSRFDVVGEQDKEVTVEIDARQLNYYDLSLEDIAKIINAQNIEIPSGSIENENEKITVTTEGAFSSIEEIKNVIIGVSQKTGGVLRLKDIADVQFSLEDSSFKIKQNGKNAILLAGYFEENKNIVLIGKEVEEKIHEFKATLPKDISFDEVLYQPTTVSHSVNAFIMNLLEGILFVIIVVLIGMGLRNAAIVSTAIPVSILMTFITMKIFGIEIHQVSITALIIALGMLVDNAIVVSDAIQVRLDKGEAKRLACVDGVKEVSIPMLTSTLTTVAAFIPLLLLNSMVGDFIQSIPQIVIISLLASYLTALFITPTMAYIFFKPSKNKEKQYRIRVFFDFLLKKGMERKLIAIILMLIFVASTGSLAARLGLQFFPKADTDMIYVDVKNERSTDLKATEKIVDEVCEILRKQPEVIGYTAAIGDGLPKFFYSMMLSTPSNDFAQIMFKVDLKKGERFKANGEISDYLQEIFNERIDGGTATVKLLEQGQPIGAPVRIRVNSEDRDRIQEVTQEIKQFLRETEGTINIEDDFGEKQYDFYVQVDPDMASYFGISKYDVQKEVSLALRGREASTFKENGKEYAIHVESNIKSKEDLENFGVKSSLTGNKALLKQVANISLKAQTPDIKKYDGEMCATIYSDVKSGYSSVEIQKQIEEDLKSIDTEGVDIIFDGEKESIDENFGDMGTLAVFAALAVYLILLIQFSSFLQPLVILLTIPFSAVGSIMGLYIFRQPLSFTGLLGIVSLLGIVVNNAIVLIDFINGERNQGKSVYDACMDAVDQRFRPIMLSTTTTVIGLIPLVLSGTQLFTPMAISLMSGLIISTLLTLVMIPIIYSIIETTAEHFHRHLNQSNLKDSF